MLGPESKTDDAGRNTPKNGPVAKEPRPERQRGHAAAQGAADDPILNEQLQALRQPGGPLAAPLNGPQIALGGSPSVQGPARRLAAATAS